MSNNKNDVFSFIRYSNCWEDSSILREALQIKSGQKGLSVASAGDNTLALLLDDPSEIIAFDLNKTQLFCVELKMAAFKALTYNEMLEFLGVKNSQRRLSLYKKVKKYISKEAADYFDSNIGLIRSGIVHAGKFERYFQLFKKYVVPVFTSHKKAEEFTKLNDLKKQKEFYKTHLDNKRLHLLFQIYFGKQVMGKLGRDKSFYRYVDNTDSIAKRIKKRFDYGISNVPNLTNPYLKYVLCNKYSKAALPEYLKRENFITIRKRLNRIKLLQCDLLSVPFDEYDFFNLSDIFEYMSEEQFDRNIGYIVNNSAPCGRVAYWNMQGNKYINTQKLSLQKKLSQRLFCKDRAFFYKDFLVYTREDT